MEDGAPGARPTEPAGVEGVAGGRGRPEAFFAARREDDVEVGCQSMLARNQRIAPVRTAEGDIQRFVVDSAVR
jgi:hypothetical protein